MVRPPENPKRADIAVPGCLKGSAVEPFSAMMPAGKLHVGGTASYKSQRPPNYRGQNHRFMRVFHRINSRLTCWVIPGLSRAQKLMTLVRNSVPCKRILRTRGKHVVASKPLYHEERIGRWTRDYV